MGTGTQANSHLPFKKEKKKTFYFKIVLDAQKKM